MRKSIDCLLDRMPETGKYNCLDFAREAWDHLEGTELPKGLNYNTIYRMLNLFNRVDEPGELAFVIFQRPFYQPHVGVYYMGRILHLTASGVVYQRPEIAKRYYREFNYYA